MSAVPQRAILHRMPDSYLTKWLTQAKIGPIALLVLAILSFGVVAEAQQFEPTRTNGADSGNNGEGAAASSVETSNGAAKSVVVFELPPARGEAQPRLSLAYSSQAGDGEAGLGWGLALPSIVRTRSADGTAQATTITPVPFTFPQQTARPPWNADRFEWAGRPLVMVCPNAQNNCAPGAVGIRPALLGTVLYQLQVDDGSQLRFFLHTAEDGYRWSVEYKSGLIETYGGSAQSTVLDPTRVGVRWHLSKAVDIDGNGVHYVWRSTSVRTGQSTATNSERGLSFLTDIFYGAKADNPDAEQTFMPGEPYEQHISLVWEIPEFPQQHYAAVWAAKPDLRLKRVDVASKPWEGGGARRQVRRYHLSYYSHLDPAGNDTNPYDPERNVPLRGHSFLRSVVLEGRTSAVEGAGNEMSEGLPNETNGPTLPPTTYRYSPRHQALGMPLPSEYQSRYPREPSEVPKTIDDIQNTAVVDINRDGWPDLVEGHRRVLRNVATASNPNRTFVEDCLEGPPKNVNSSTWENYWKWIFSARNGLTVEGAWGHDHQGPSMFFRSNEFRNGLAGDRRTVPGVQWVLGQLLTSSTPCEHAPIGYSPQSWKISRIPHDTEIKPIGPSLTNQDRIVSVGDVDGDGLADGYVQTEGNAATLPNQPGAPVIRFSRRMRGQPQNIGKFAERVATNLLLEGFICGGNLDNCKYYETNGDELTGANAAFDERVRSLVDLNGDGLADAVGSTRMRKLPPSGAWNPNFEIGYYAGDGRGNFACSETRHTGLALCDGHLGQRFGVSDGSNAMQIELQNRTPWDTSQPMSRPLFHDINGDGFADIIIPRKFSGELAGPRVYFAIFLNEGGFRFRRYCAEDPSGNTCVGAQQPGLVVGRKSLTTDPFVKASPLAAPNGDELDFTPYRVAFADLNADGIDEIVVFQKGGVSTLGFNEPMRAGLLTSVDNGFGGRTTFTYDTYQHHIRNTTADVPRNQLEAVTNVVTSVTTTNSMSGLPSRTHTVSYKYRMPAFDSWRRALVGFGEVVANEFGGPSVRKRFHYAPCHLADGCAATSDLDEASLVDGVLVSEEVLDRDPTESIGPPRVLRQTLHRYESKTLPTAERLRKYVFLVETKIRLFNPDGSPTPTKVSVPVVVRSGAHGEPIISDEEVVLWTSADSRLLLKKFEYDDFGNTKKVRDFGQVADDLLLTPLDQVLISTTEWARVVPFLWVWRVVDRVSTDSAASSPARHVRYNYKPGSWLLETIDAELIGTLELARTHEAGAVAPKPGSASVDGYVVQRRFEYNTRGKVVTVAGPFARRSTGGPLEGPCNKIAYDGNYGHFPYETGGGAKATLGTSGCTSALPGGLLTSFAAFDRGLGTATLNAGPAGQITFVNHDDFGRLSSVLEPDPYTPVLPSPVVRATVEYSYAVDHLAVHTMRGDGGETYDYIDGLGSHIMGLERTAPGANAGWVAHGVTSTYSNGLPHEAYVPVPYSGSPTAPTWVGGSTRVMYGFDIWGRPTTVSDVTSSGSTLLAKTNYGVLHTTTFDAEGAAPTGLHAGNSVTHVYDGHFREHTTQRTLGADNELTSRYYNGNGEVYTEFRQHTGPESHLRAFEYDSLGRMVRQWEPNTRTDGNTWIYAYDDAGRLVGTSDARGCGENIHYDVLGRLVAEDFSPCLSSQPSWSAPNLATGDGTESFRVYDTPVAGDPAGNPAASAGRLVAVKDRGSHTRYGYDLRGRRVATSRQIAKPGVATDVLATRYTSHWFRIDDSFDLFDRATRSTTGADVPELLVEGESAVSLVYGTRGEVAAIGSSYGALITSTSLRADGRLTDAVYGDAAATQATFTYEPNARARMKTSHVRRGPTAPAIWSTPEGGGAPSAAEPTRQADFLKTSVDYDRVGNPLVITDDLPATAWPSGARPKTTTASYDEHYRLTRAVYGTGTDSRTSPYAPTDGTRPVPRLARTSRMTQQDFGYDWRGNITSSTSNDNDAVFDQFLGQQAHGADPSHPYDTHPDRLKSATVGANEIVSAHYDASGNMVDLFVKRQGACDGPACNHRFLYDWNEVGQLQRARRWDYATVTGGTPLYPTEPATDAAYDLEYAYSGMQRVRKSVAQGPDKTHTLEVFPSLRVERTTFDAVGGEYDRTADNEIVYLAGVGRAHYGAPDHPGAALGRTRISLFIADRLGSASVVIDHRTSEVVEKISYDANGNVESDYRPARWGASREHYRFTGKEEDIEVGLTYFGARYLSTNLRRWISPDPLTVHGRMGDSNPYAYVGGRTLAATDPFGLTAADVVNHGEFGTSTKDADGHIEFSDNARKDPGSTPGGASEIGVDANVGESGSRYMPTTIAAAFMPTTMFGALRPPATGADAGPRHWGGVRQQAADGAQELITAGAGIAQNGIAVGYGAYIAVGAAVFGGALIAVAEEVTLQAAAACPTCVKIVAAGTSVAAGLNGQDVSGPSKGGAASLLEDTGGVVRQLTPNSCGQTCGVMLLADRGMQVSRGFVASQVGHAGATEGSELAAGLSQIDVGWRGGIVAQSAFGTLNRSGSWAAMIGRGRIGHWVVVDGIEGASVLLRDPARGVVSMPTKSFMEVWNGSAVFK